ncbi:MAG: LodA/GoxA family CTQ-dependent oxidase, partial [Anaerolineales bacterium]
MTNTFKIHPAIGIARLGDSTTEFCLAPETPMGLPTKCDSQGRALLDAQGKEQPVDTFKDSQGRIKRQAARFQVYVYQDANDKLGRELKIGDSVQVYKWQTGELYSATLLDIEWTVYLANKKASWYQFKELEGEHGYAPDHPLRNASITGADARQRLIIDPGPQTVSYSHTPPRRAEFAKGKNPAFPQSFPPPLSPNSVETLGETIVSQQNDHNRLVVLGGYGNSGSFKSGFGEPRIETFANNDGWFDDISDGPVTANLWVQPLTDDGQPQSGIPPLKIPVDDPA